MSDKHSGSYTIFEYIGLMIYSKNDKPLFISVIYHTGTPLNAKVSDCLLEFDDYVCNHSAKANLLWIIFWRL